MASASEVKALADHYEWLGYLQPVGLLVSPAALLDCQAYVDRNIASQQQALLECLGGEEPRQVADFTCFAQLVLGWRPDDALPLASNETLLEALSVSLPEYSQTLCPTFCVQNPHSSEDAPPYLMLIKQIDSAQDFDRPTDDAPTGWKASPQAKFERLLRETGIPIGILFNGEALRLVYCPVGENSGHTTFPFEAMAGVAGRPILSALHMLLCAERLFSLPTEQRLPALLAHSRNAQSRVSEQLAGQVLAALYEMVRGFQAANAALKGDLLNELLAADPDQVYKGVLTVLMRLVFLLYAEDRGLISASQLYSNFYSVTGLFNRLRSDAALHPDTMEQRYGAWAQLLVLFRLIHRGTPHTEMSIPPREGYLFDPDRYPFLEGQRPTTPPENASQPELPRISDRVIYRVLEKLMVLDGQRLSYRTLDVEQIGSVYETMIGFELIVTTGSSIVLRPSAGSGAPAVLNLDAVLAIAPEKRAGWIKDQTGHEPKGQSAKDVQSARTVADVLISLEKKIDREITPALVSTGAMLLHPTDERRRSGSHYTPRSLTQPIVRKALEPVLAALGAAPEPERILDLKICDPAMGSGAFLVEVCRQLADQLVRSWRFHKRQPTIPVDEDEILHARRLVAQSCLYGVDRNPMAVDLARLSLWLATLAQDHPFTFLDHVLRCGDSLVGLTRKQIVDGRWRPTGVRIFGQEYVEDRINKAAALRTEIFAAGDAGPSGLKAAKLALADEAINGVRFFGDVVIAAFFSAPKDKLRQANRDEFVNRLASYLHSGNLALRPGDVVNALRSGPKPVIAFHWEVEFPEVFDRENAGFDSMVGNPPFAGKNTLIAANRQYYPDWLDEIHEQSNGNTDLAAHFFRRAFNLLRPGGTMGLIATNTIAQGDTRSTGLRYICTHGGTIYAARRRYKWPGQAAVVVSIVHIFKSYSNMPPPPCDLDGRKVDQITAFLFHAGGHDDPHKLPANAGQSFQGSILLGMGFTFDDTDKKGIASPIAEMHRLITKDPRNAQRIFPYIGGDELCTSPTHAHHRYAIDFGEMSREQAAAWPDLLAIVEAKVKPERMRKEDTDARTLWWRFLRRRPELYAVIAGFDHVLAVTCSATPWMAFVLVPTKMIFANSLAIIAMDQFSSFALLQSRIHEIWTRFFASSLEERLRYTPTDCFETFPFPEKFQTDVNLEKAGHDYYEFRAQLMIHNNQGLTETYNRFHDPAESSADILTLRELHTKLDQAVLDAYGWNDLQPVCKFILDYEDDPENESPGPATESKKKKPWRYRWPDETRDEILARLLLLNQQRHTSTNPTPHKPATPVAAPHRRARKSAAPVPTLFPNEAQPPNDANTGNTARSNRQT